jgi:alpha-L-fucosidase
LDAAFKTNLAKNAKAKASSYRGNYAAYAASALTDEKGDTYWTTDDNITQAAIEINLDQTKKVSYILLQQYIRLGQRVKSFSIEVWQANQWRKAVTGTTIGYKRILKIDPVETNKIRVIFSDAKACPVLSEIGIY